MGQVLHTVGKVFDMEENWLKNAVSTSGDGLGQGFCNVTYCFQVLCMFGKLFVFPRFPELPEVHKYSFVKYMMILYICYYAILIPLPVAVLIFSLWISVRQAESCIYFSHMHFCLFPGFMKVLLILTTASKRSTG